MRSSFWLITLTGLSLILAGCSSEKKAEEHLSQAGRYFEDGDYDKAEIEYRTVLQIEPGRPEAMARLAILYFEQGRLSMIKPLLERALQLDPENLDVRLKRGFFDISLGQRDAAREQALYVLERRPGDPDAPLILADAAGTPEEIEAAQARLEAVPAPAVNGAPVLTAMGSLELQRENFDNARDLFDRALQQDPSFSATHAAFAFLHRRQNNVEETRRSLQRASELAPARSPRRLLHAQFLIRTNQVEAGRSALEAVTKSTPDFLPPYLMLAELAAREEKYEESAEHIGKVLARDPGHPEALLFNGRLKIASGDRAAAVEDMERMARAYPGLPQAHYQLGMAHYAHNNFPLAVNSLRQAVLLAADYSDAIVLLSDLYVRQGDFPSAIGTLLPFVQANPENVQAKLILANAQRGQGNLDAALNIYREIETAFPENFQTRLLIGAVLRLQDKRGEARAAFNRALELSPDNDQALQQLVALDLLDGKPADALPRVESRLARDPNAISATFLQARIQLAQRDFANAEGTLQKIIAQSPEAAEPHELLAQVYGASGQRDKAIASLEQAASRNPRNVEVLMALATFQQNQGSFELARDYYEKAIAAHPRFGPALNNLAYVYAEHLNDLGKAHELAQRAREAMPNDPNVADTLGWILYRQGQFAWALTLLQESAARLGNHPEIQYHLGLAQYMTGAETAARATLARALQLAPEFPGRPDAVQRLEVLSINPTDPGAAARPVLEKALTSQPNDPIALVRLASLEEQSGNAAAAIENYSKALQVSPTSLNAAGSLARLHLTRTDNASALEVARALRKVLPEDAEAAHIAGKVALQSGDYSWAYSLLQEAALRKSGDRDAQFELAQAAYAMGRVDEAGTALSRSLQGTGVFLRADEARRFQAMMSVARTPTANATAQVDAVLSAEPTYTPGLMARGALREQAGNSADARADYQAVLARYPEFVPAKRRLAIIAAATATAADPAALQFALKAREAYPTDTELGKAYGILLYRQGDFNRAINLLDEATRQRTNDAEAWFFLGASQHALKRTEDSKQSLERALGLQLRDDLATEARTLLGQ